MSFSVFLYAALAPKEDSYRFKCIYIIQVQKVVQNIVSSTNYVQNECFVLE